MIAPEDMPCSATAAIARTFRPPWFYVSLDLWKYWETIDSPTLVLHGYAILRRK
jgi:hypothetical protein